MKINRKGTSEEGVKFNMQQVAMLILFLAVLAIGIIILIPKLTSGAVSDTTSGFGKYIWDIFTGGKQ